VRLRAPRRGRNERHLVGDTRDIFGPYLPPGTPVRYDGLQGGRARRHLPYVICITDCCYKRGILNANPWGGNCMRTARDHFLSAVVVCAGIAATVHPAAANCSSVATPAPPSTGVAIGNTGSGLGACGATTGKVLYDCVANVLDRLSNDVSRSGSSAGQEAARALSSAASGLRSVASKVQALSVIGQARSIIASVMIRVRSIGGSDSGLGTVAAVLAQAARLIQSKG
jgi:hypothetical protein